MKLGSLTGLSSVVVALALLGCKPGGTPPASIDGSQTGATEQPDAVVTRFYECMRKADTDGATQLLTQKAREETKKQGFEVQKASPAMTYQIGQTLYDEEDKSSAQVGSVITDKDETGVAFSYNMICVMRRETAGWRISGMAIEFNGDNTFVNLEADDLTRQREEAESAQATDNAAQPATPSNGVESSPAQTGPREAATQGMR